MRHGGLLVRGGALLACCLLVLPLSYRYSLPKQYTVHVTRHTLCELCLQHLQHVV
jgi:hypothetical protein